MKIFNFKTRIFYILIIHIPIAVSLLFFPNFSPSSGGGGFIPNK